MRRLIGASWVIARRDYVATVWSRTFLIFLLGPLLPVLFAGVIAALPGGDDARARAGVQLATDPGSAAALLTARARLAARLGPDALPALRVVATPDPARARIEGTLDRPRLAGPRADLPALGGAIGLIVDQARAERALGGRAPAPVDLPTTVITVGGGGRAELARGGQFALFMLTLLLASMLISNMVEEKASKVIELLAAAVPIDAIFLGKLLAMLGVSLTGILVWAVAALAGAALLLPPAALAAPAVGWPIFLLLGLVYFTTLFLLWGAVYLGIGAQAGSAREAQTLSLPMALAQALGFALASAQATRPEQAIVVAASLIPWSSPVTMIARAALQAALWPHLLAILWQLVALFLIVKLGAALFRTNILKSGRPRRFWARRQGE